ncbi:hypothetical protein NM688_g57 [Phlebia brevispora]|uniref:Uncharacterized protein n=1 Tax=Phlebia brevispora TaxID=194682 RepID=A0ACC1TFE6_9APHY|nr:hypothetical protein NM688_g57 [Phlebia brevispora]
MGTGRPLGMDTTLVTHPGTLYASHSFSGAFETVKGNIVTEWDAKAASELAKRDLWNANISSGLPVWVRHATNMISDYRNASSADPASPDYQPKSFIHYSSNVGIIPWHPSLLRMVLPFSTGLSRLSAYASHSIPGDTDHLFRADHRLHAAPLPQIAFDDRFQLHTIGHSHKRHDIEEPDKWKNLSTFLLTGSLPSDIADSPSKTVKFKQMAFNFFCKERIRMAHNEARHRSCDTTYQHLKECYWWPNMYDDIAWFIRSCNACQFHAKSCPMEPLRMMLSPTILWVFCADTIDMLRDYNGNRYLLHVSCTTSKWSEAVAAHNKTSATWVKFLYERVISCFGCFLYLVCDGGPEFKDAVRILTDKYHITIILSSLYHPEGNGIAERDSQTLANAIMKSCAQKPTEWPLYLPAALLAINTTTSRATGYTPYFLLYSQQALFSYDVADRTWFVLDWDTVQSREDLLALRMQQIARRDSDIGTALEHLEEFCCHSNLDCMHANAHKLRMQLLEPGTWVLVHETHLDNQHGKRSALRWAGPFVVHHHHPSRAYALCELDGTLLTGSVAGSRLKIVNQLPAPYARWPFAVYQPYPFTCRLRAPDKQPTLAEVHHAKLLTSIDAAGNEDEYTYDSGFHKTLYFACRPVR